MSDLDVALRLRLVNQLSRPAEEAERDLKELQQVAERLGRTRGGDQLGAGIRQIGQAATDARGKLGSVAEESEQLRQKLGRLNNTRGLEGIKVDAGEAKQALSTIGSEADELRRKLGLVDDSRGLDSLRADAGSTKEAIATVGSEADALRQKLGQIGDAGFSDLKQDADAAKQAIESIGTAASEAKGKVDLLDDTSALAKLKQDAQEADSAIRQIGRGVPDARRNLDDAWRRTPNTVSTQHDPRYGRIGQGIEGLADRTGVDAWIPIGATAGYMVGGAAGAAAFGVGRAYKRYAGDDRETEYILMNMGVPEEEGADYRNRVRDIAKDQRVPYAKAIEGLNALAATGMKPDAIMTMLPAVMKTSLASNAEPADVAASAFAIMDKMKIAPQDIGAALDAMVGGGNMGQFEVPDMARYLPSILAYSSQAGLEGIDGLRKVIAMLQAVRMDTGDSSQAATNLQNVFAKMGSEETERNFKEYGINLPAEYKRGRAAGKDDPEILYEAAMKASKGGDPDILKRLFVDQQAFLGLLSLVKNKDRIKADIDELEKVRGIVDQQHQRVASDPQASLDALANAADRATVAVGGLADKLGLTWALEKAAEKLDYVAEKPGERLPQYMFELTMPGGPATADLLRWLFGGTGGSDGQAQASPETEELNARKKKLQSDLSGVDAMPAGPLADTARQSIQAEIDAVERLLAAEADRLKRAAEADPEQGPVPGLSKPQKLPDTMPAPLAKPMGPAAEQSMDSYNKALQSETQEGVGIVQGFVDTIRSMLNFTAGPTIQPTLAPPAGGAPAAAPAGGVQKSSSAAPTGGNVRLTQNISAPNSTLAARRAVREQNRSVRLAQNRALHDLGSLA